MQILADTQLEGRAEHNTCIATVDINMRTFAHIAQVKKHIGGAADSASRHIRCSLIAHRSLAGFPSLAKSRPRLESTDGLGFQTSPCLKISGRQCPGITGQVNGSHQPAGRW